MKKQEKYDPEDMESLMMHKSFEELYPEEKEFVLRHLDGPEDYESMRRTLFAVREEISKGSSIKPDPAVRSRLLENFTTEEKGGWKVWLNSLFVLPERRQWAIPVAIAAVSLLVWFFAFDQSKPIAQLAENKVKEEQLDKEAEERDSKVKPTETVEENKTVPEELPAPEAELLEESVYEDLAEEDEMKVISDEFAYADNAENTSKIEIEETAKTLSDEAFVEDDIMDINDADIEEVLTTENQTVTFNSAPTNNQNIEALSSRQSSGLVVSNNATADSELFELLYTSY